VPAEHQPLSCLEKSFRYKVNRKMKVALASLHAIKRNFLPLRGIKRLFLSSLDIANNFELAYNESNTFFESVIDIRHFETKTNKYYITRDNCCLQSLRRISYFTFHHISRELDICLTVHHWYKWYKEQLDATIMVY